MQAQNHFTSLSSNKPTHGSSNPFARALAETEKQAGTNGRQSTEEQFNQNDSSANNGSQEQFLKQQQEKAAKERLRRQLHDRINPVNAKDVFNARQEQVKKEMDQLRHELRQLSVEIGKFHKEIEVTLMARVVDPGVEGSYFRNFFQQLRYWIMLFRQQIQSARTWATQFSSKNKKKKSKNSAGIAIEGSGHEQTKSIFDTMHHEVSNAYGG